MSYDPICDRVEDHKYYRRRAAEEARRAEVALTPEARRSHRDLAEIFGRKAQATETEAMGAPENVMQAMPTGARSSDQR